MAENRHRAPTNPQQSSGPRAQHPALSQTLEVLLPDRRQTLFLRACVWPSAEGAYAWREWRQLVGDAKAAIGNHGRGVGRLLPLLYESLRRSGAEVDPALLPYLRAARLHEEMRAQACRRICSEVLGTLAADRIPFLVVQGAALAETVYPSPASRHVHDIDVLVREQDLPRAVALLRGAKVARREGTESHPAHVRLVHASGLAIQFHSRLFRVRLFDMPWSDLFSRARARQISRVEARVLSPADALVQVCGQAACCAGRESLQWICDAWYLVAAHPELDWRVFVDGAAQARLALPAFVQLRYLATEMKLPIPPAVIEQLGRTAAAADNPALEAALIGARAGSRATLANLLRNSEGWRERARVLKLLLLPSATTVRELEQPGNPWWLPLCYIHRPARYLARGAREWWRRRLPAMNGPATSDLLEVGK
jgi:hypothetical protein